MDLPHRLEYDLQLEPLSISECNREFGNSGYDSFWRPGKAESNPGRKPRLGLQPGHLLEKAGGTCRGLMLSLRTEWSDLMQIRSYTGQLQSRKSNKLSGGLHDWRYFYIRVSSCCISSVPTILWPGIKTEVVWVQRWRNFLRWNRYSAGKHTLDVRCWNSEVVENRIGNF